MGEFAEYASFAIFILIYLAIFVFCAIAIKRRLFDNKQIGKGFFIGRSIFSQYQTGDRREAVEEIIFEEEEGRDEALSGEGFGLDKKKPHESESDAD
jgi:hypothetical protein